VGSTHDYLLFFTDRGRVYREKIYDLPEAERAARGGHIRNLLPLAEGENVQTVLSLKDLDQDGHFVFATKGGLVKRTRIREYGNINAAGLVAINLLDGDELVAVRITDGNADVVLGTRDGQAIRFAEEDARETGRATQGVIGIRLKRGDAVVSLAVIQQGQKEKTELLSVTESGLGKRTSLAEYPVQGRGGQGVIGHRLSDRTGAMVTLSPVLGSEELFVLSENGILIRTSVAQVSSYGRSTQGVTVMRLDDGDRVVAAMVMPSEAELEAMN
jgi:DNA gyrase subunit A